jgi:hypothetical protein
MPLTVISSVTVFAGLAIVAADRPPPKRLHSTISTVTAITRFRTAMLAHWDNVFIYDATHDPASLNPSGYQFSVISLNVAFTGHGEPITVSSDTVFNLNSAYLTAVWKDNMVVEATGSLLGATIYDFTYPLSATAATPIDFNFLGIDSFQLSIFSEGTQHPGYGQATNQVAIDNLNVDVAVPEPSTWLAAALALGATGFSQRKRMRARASFAAEKHS